METTAASPRTVDAPLSPTSLQRAPVGADVAVARETLNGVAARFGACALDDPARGILDVKVMAAVQSFEPCLIEFRAAIADLAGHPDDDAVAELVTGFFEGLLPHKQSPAGGSFLWADGYRYLLRELFLTAVATFVHRGDAEKAGRLLDHVYACSRNRRDMSFVAFDAYVKSLDEFRNRRLILGRRSLCADLIRRRADDRTCPFATLMQVDLVLCLRSLVHEQDFFNRWYPRTLVLADDVGAEGLEMFRAARVPHDFTTLARLLRVADRDTMIERFEQVFDAWNLDRWELAGEPLDLRRLIGLDKGGATV